MALRDTFNPNKIDALAGSECTPRDGATLAVAAFDDVEVIVVKITLYDSARRIVTSGEAAFDPRRWRFKVPPRRPPLVRL